MYIYIYTCNLTVILKTCSNDHLLHYVMFYKSSRKQCDASKCGFSTALAWLNRCSSAERIISNGVWQSRRKICSANILEPLWSSSITKATLDSGSWRSRVSICSPGSANFSNRSGLDVWPVLESDIMAFERGANGAPVKSTLLHHSGSRQQRLRGVPDASREIFASSCRCTA